MTDPADKASDTPVALQDENTGVDPPDTTATADALGGGSNLPRVEYDPTTHTDDMKPSSGT